MREDALLIVAGHDSSGRAGVAADREAARAFGLDPGVVVTAWTEQDANAVYQVRAMAPEAWAAEVRRRLPVPAAVLKVGLLAGVSHVRMMSVLAAECSGPIVVDPVLRASSGRVFLGPSGREALLAQLVPKGVFLTPNLPEAACLTGADLEELVEDLQRRLVAARELLDRGAGGVVLKGGHARGEIVRDLVLARGKEPEWIEHPRVAGPGMGGSGCRHATALAAGLALGNTLARAAAHAGDYVAGLLSRS